MTPAASAARSFCIMIGLVSALKSCPPPPPVLVARRAGAAPTTIFCAHNNTGWVSAVCPTEDDAFFALAPVCARTARVMTEL
eukprot:3254319-Pyramimonas_sp.AAC.1